MSQNPRRRIPILPSVVIVVGLLVGITGLLMLLLGLGVISPTVLNIPGINLNLQTATPGIVVMVTGFTVALVPIVMAMRVDEARAQSSREDSAPYTGGVVDQINTRGQVVIAILTLVVAIEVT